MNKLRNFIHTYGNAYFFIGFFLIQYLGISTMAAAIFGACIALIVFFNSQNEKEASAS